eukprot:6202494-Pyramimonas_sp.AAC.1
MLAQASGDHDGLCCLHGRTAEGALIGDVASEAGTSGLWHRAGAGHQGLLPVGAQPVEHGGRPEQR